MPEDTSIKSVLIFGSGPIIIGQACEFELPFHKVPFSAKQAVMAWISFITKYFSVKMLELKARYSF